MLLLAVAAYIAWEWSQSPKGLIDWPSLWALFKN
jgi:hypothetical protein